MFQPSKVVQDFFHPECDDLFRVNRLGLGWCHLVRQTLGRESLADDGATTGERAAGTFAQQDLAESWQNYGCHVY